MNRRLIQALRSSAGILPAFGSRAVVSTRLTASIGGLIALGVLTACQKETAPPPTQVEVQASTVTSDSITAHFTVDAVLTPVAQAAITPKITAPVAKFYVQRGAHVKAGELLATLENRDLSASMKDNQGALQSAQATYQTTVQAQVPQDYQRAELDVAQAQASLNLNQKIVESRKQLFAQGAIAGRDLDTAEAALVDAQATFDAATKRLAGMKQVSREAAIKNAGGQLESVQGKYQAATAALSYSEIRTPISGVVTDRPLFAGETATSGTTLITVMETATLVAKAHVPQEALATIKKGDKSDVYVPSLDRTVEGEIVLISPALDPGSSTVEIWVAVKNPKGELRPGSSARVTIAGKSLEKAAIVPSQSIVKTADGKQTVMVVGADGIAHRTVVTTGIEDSGNVQILSGLAPGKRVVTEGAYALDDGTHVKVVTAAEESGAGDKE